MSALLSNQIRNTHNQISTLSNGIIANLSYEDDRWHFNGKPMTDSEINELRSLLIFMDHTLDDARSALGFC